MTRKNVARGLALGIGYGVVWWVLGALLIMPARLMAAPTHGPLISRPAKVQLTHEQLAALAGTSRETTTKVLGEFAGRGMIKLGRGKITILDARLSPRRRASDDGAVIQQR